MSRRRLPRTERWKFRPNCRRSRTETRLCGVVPCTCPALKRSAHTLPLPAYKRRKVLPDRCRLLRGDGLAFHFRAQENGILSFLRTGYLHDGAGLRFSDRLPCRLLWHRHNRYRSFFWRRSTALQSGNSEYLPVLILMFWTVFLSGLLLYV